MGNYKYENGNYYRLSSTGEWFKVNRNNDGYLTWTLPDGKNVYDDSFIVPITMLTSQGLLGTEYSVPIGANGSIGCYNSFQDAVNAYTKAINRGAFSDPGENVLNDAMFDIATLGLGKTAAIATTMKGINALSRIVPQVGKTAGKTVGKTVWDASKRLVTGLVTKESVKLALKTTGKTTGKFIGKVAPYFVIGGAGGHGVNKISENLTGKTFGENVAEGLTSHYGFRVSPFVAEFANPGYALGGPVMNGTKAAIMNLNYYIPWLTDNLTLRNGFGWMLNKFGLGTGYLNIRYRNGIRDYIGNVISKYSTTALKPSVFTGNLLELARKRVLDNLEKYGIKNTDNISWTTTADDPNLIQLAKSIGFEIPNGLASVTVTMPARTYLEHITPLEGKEAMFTPNSASIFHQNTGYIEDIQKLYPEFLDAHEFSHAIDWILHNKTAATPKTSGGVHIQLNNTLEDLYATTYKPGSRINLGKNISEINIPGLNYNKIRLNISILKYLRDPSELKARYELIRNWLGITDERSLTLSEWNLAKRYYTSIVGDNNMQEFFKLVENPEEFINWASKRYTNTFNGLVSRATIERLPREKTPVQGSYYYSYKVNHDDELPGFLEVIQELAGGKAPISETNGLTVYATPKPATLVFPSERTPDKRSIPRIVYWRKDPDKITAGDLAYGLAHNLPGWNRNIYKGILKDTGKWGKDYEETARALMYDIKAQLYKKLSAEKGGPLTNDEFIDGLWDLTKQDFLKAFRNAHGGHYVRNNLLTFDVNNLTIENITDIINVLSKYKNGGKFHKKGIFK